MPEEAYQPEDYRPGKVFLTLFWTAAILIVSAGILISVNARYEEPGNAGWLWFAGTLVAAVVGPTVVQYALLRYFGARPSRTRWTERNESYLILLWKPERHKLTRKQFALVSGVPGLLLWAILIPYSVTYPVAAGAISFALTTFVGNFLYSVLALRKPSGTLVEKVEKGLRLYVPARRTQTELR